MADEERKGHLKVTIDVEINEDLMDVMEKSMTEVPKQVAEKIAKGE